MAGVNGSERDSYPLHAFPEEIAKYRGKYRQGWEELRRQRHAGVEAGNRNVTQEFRIQAHHSDVLPGCAEARNPSQGQA